MIGAGPDMLQSEGYINRMVELQSFYRDKSLVVIEGDDIIEFTLPLAMKDGVGGQAVGYPGI